jgi:hypothetical protein
MPSDYANHNSSGRLSVNPAFWPLTLRCHIIRYLPNWDPDTIPI